MNPVSRSRRPSLATARLSPSPRRILLRNTRLLLGMTLLFIILWQLPGLISGTH
ncbi:hypothetical protein [Herminiimonas fonticola]|uniref:hypothetical protein n=1 Tax=Herminiimonas fonticola TaxID=303380 RepID=UPI0033418984